MRVLAFMGFMVLLAAFMLVMWSWVTGRIEVRPALLVWITLGGIAAVLELIECYRNR